jgi:hypothetical protein
MLPWRRIAAEFLIGASIQDLKAEINARFSALCEGNREAFTTSVLLALGFLMAELNRRSAAPAQISINEAP